MKIDKNFRRLRSDLNLTQQDVAVILGVSRVTYNKWETRPETMPLGRYEQLMDEFKRLKELREGDKH